MKAKNCEQNSVERFTIQKRRIIIKKNGEIDKRHIVSSVNGFLIW